MASGRAGRTKKRRSGAQGDAALDALLARIHAANPTGRALSAREERARYEEKARLQSELIEGWSERVAVRVHDDMPGIVSLSVPSLERSAGHAVVEDLSIHARELLEARLALADADAAPRTGDPPRRSPQEGDVERAMRYIDEYDFECAERVLREAVAGASVDASRALKELILLYVERLGRDADALRAAEENPHLATSSESRRALGLAAARVGRFDLAVTHLRHASGPEVASAVAVALRGALEVRSWRVVRDALELLRREAAHRGDSAFSCLRDEEDRARVVLRAVRSEDLLAESGLADLVDLLLPNHPARLALREQARERRVRDNVERCLGRLAAAEAAADRLAAEAAIADLEPMRVYLSAAERSRVERASHTLRSQRVQEAAREIVERARRAPDDGTLLSYLRLPSDVRAEARKTDETHIFELVERLSSSPHADHAVARAAAAWQEASAAPPDGRSWAKIAPHAAVLSLVPEIACELDVLRSAAPGGDADGAFAVARERPSVRSSSERLRAAVTTSSRSVCEPKNVVLARGLLRVDGAEWVAAVARIADDAHEVRLHATQSRRSGAPIVLQLLSDAEWSPVAAVASGAELHLVTRTAEHHVLSFEDGIAVRDLPALDVTNEASRQVVCEGELLALVEPSPVGLDHVVLGAAQPTTARLCSPSLELRRGDETVSFAIPLVEPLMVIDSPSCKEDAPILLELESGSDRPFVWQRVAEDLWRGFRLRDAGVPVSAFTLPSRGVLLVTPSGPTGLRVDRLLLEGERLRAAQPLDVARGLGVVVDDARRRAWAVGLDEAGLGLSIMPIGLRRAGRSTRA